MIGPGAGSTALADILTADERVVWAGQPDLVATFRTQSVWWWLGAPILAIAVALHVTGAVAAGLAFVPGVIGAVFLAAPLLMTVHAHGTVYVITDRRVIINHDALGQRQVVSYAFAQLDDTFEILPGCKGTGHLYFASGASSNVASSDFTGKVAFRNLRNPQHVAAAIEAARKQTRQR